MKPLERRKWFELMSMAIATGLMFLLWRSVLLPLNMQTFVVFVFATLGVNQGVNTFLALLLIKIKPSLGKVE
jgi:hypothetical protein